jgi:3'(2'), 5'-bisphosphate nucleotidase
LEPFVRLRTLHLLNARTAELVAALCRRAGRAIMEVYREDDFGTRLKLDRSPVTLADLAAHRVLVDGLGELTPGLPVLSEESDDIPWSERRRWGAHWLVDPLDGTKEFVKRNDEFTVNVALIRDHKPVMGVVHAPVFGTTYWAVDGLGAYKQTAQGFAPIRVSERKIPRRGKQSDVRSLTMIVSRSHIREGDARFMEEMGKIYAEPQLLRVGSSLKICMIAEGRADVYPRMGPTSEWDIAAGQCVLEQAGGVVAELDGRRLRYNKADLLNPFFIARSAGVELPHAV